MGKKLIRTHRDLDVYQMGFEVAMQIFEMSKSFPKEERYSLTDQIRRSSRAAETQVWLEFAFQCGYLKEETFRDLSVALDNILGKIVSLINHPQQWLLPGAKRR